MSIIIIAKNQTANQVVINDLSGCRIPASGEYELTKSRRLNTIYSSVDLVTLINEDKILLNDGTSDLTKAESLAYVLPFNTNSPLPNITLKSPDNTAWKTTVDNDGVLTTSN